MKINDVNRIQGINKYQQLNQKDSKDIKNNSQKRDQISISEEAKALLEKNKEVTSSNPRVDELKSEINNGTYKVDSQKVADKLVDWFKK